MDVVIGRGNEHVILGVFFSDYQCDCDDKGDGIGQKDEDGRTEIIISRTEYGQMVDFLKQNPFVTREEYMWEWTIPQIRLASYDFTHVKYLSEEETKNKKNKTVTKTINSAEDLINDLGFPIFNK